MHAGGYAPAAAHIIWRVLLSHAGIITRAAAFSADIGAQAWVKVETTRVVRFKAGGKQRASAGAD